MSEHFRDALTKAREDYQRAKASRDALAEEMKTLNHEMDLTQRLIDALEIQLGEATEVEVFKRRKNVTRGEQ